jgi:hypothetical protein
MEIGWLLAVDEMAESLKSLGKPQFSCGKQYLSSGHDEFETD